jgi:predicted alpha/beta superfamily hydrolase
LPRRLRVYLPADYDADPTRRYPTLYMHDGQNLFSDADSAFGEWHVDETLDALTAAGLVEPHLVVGIDNTADRTAEYPPDLLAGPDPAKAGLYADFVAQVVVPLAEAELRAACTPDARTVGGSSFGGLASLHLALRHPGVFGRVAAVSPSLWWQDGAIVSVLAAFAGPWPERLWLDMGTLESGEGGGPLPSTLVARLREVRDIARAAGLPYGDRVGALEDFGAAHNEAAWSGRLGAILVFLAGAERPLEHPPEIVALRPYAPALSTATTPKTSVATEVFWPSGARLTWPADLAALATTTPALVTLAADGTVTAKSPGTASLSAAVLGQPAALALPVVAAGQVPVTFAVTVPPSTPPGDTVHVTGDLAALGAWDGAGIALTRAGPHLWTATIALPQGTAFEFKVTRGSWSTVEKAADGSELPNRKATATAATTLAVTVQAWADL